MRYTLLPRMHLSRLPLSTRVLITAFLVSISAGLVVSSLKYTQRAEFTPSGAARYYHGDANRAVASESAPATDTPLLEGENQIEDRKPGLFPPAERKSLRYLVDTVHPHAFTVPVLLFILLHFLSLTRIPERWRIVFHLHAFASFLATFGLPFLIASHGSGAWLFVVAGVNLFASFFFVTAILLYETWIGRAPTSEREESPDRSTVVLPSQLAEPLESSRRVE